MIDPFPHAAPDFSDPLGLLRACHGRIESHCSTLQRLVPHLAQHGLDADAREAITRIHRYFATAAQHHHQDEECDLFPLLQGRDPRLDALIAELLQDHAALSNHWDQLNALLAQPDEVMGQQAVLARVVEQFVAAYLAHAQRENQSLLPRAAQLLHSDELARLGAAMAKRRGVA